MTDSFDVLEPSGSSVTYRGEGLEITPIKIGELPKLVRTTRGLINALLEMPEVPEEGDGLVALILDLLADHGEAAFEAAAICIGRPVEWVRGGDVDEFVLLAQAVMGVNRDFFVQRLAPLLGQRLELGLRGAGQTPSSS